MPKAFIVRVLCLLFLSLPTFLSAQTPKAIEIDKRLQSADSLRKRIKFSDAWNQLSVVSSLKGEMDTVQLAQYYKIQGAVQVGIRKYPEALESYTLSKEYLEKLTTPKSKVDLVNLYTLNAIVYNKIGDFERAKEIILAGIEQSKLLPKKDSILSLKYLYNNLGETYELLGQYDDAVKTNYIALDIIKELDQEISVGAGVANNNLGIAYRQLGRYNLSKKHFELAAELFSTTLGPNSRYTNAARSNAATAIDSYGDIEQAIPILIKAIDVHLEDPGRAQDYIVNTYSTLGYIYKRIGDYDKSIESYERALGKLRSMDIYKRGLEIRILKSMASAKINQQQWVSARRYLDEAFEIERTHQVLTSSDFVRLQHVNATYYQATNQPDQYFKAISAANRVSTNDEQNQLSLYLLTKPRYISALLEQGDFDMARRVIDSTITFTEKKKSKISPTDMMMIEANIDQLKAQMASKDGTYFQSFENGLYDRLKAHSLKLIDATASTPGKKNQRFTCSTCFNIGDLLNAMVNLHLQSYQDLGSAGNEHLQKALTLLDIKQSYLSNIWENEHFSSLPKAQKAHARELRQRIAAYELLIFENDSNSPAAQKQNALYLDSILILRPQLTAYIKSLKATAPDFDKRIDYSNLSSDQGMLLFHLESNSLHILFAHSDGLLHTKLEEADTLGFKLNTYRQFCQSENQGFRESLETLQLGAELYRTLVGWIPANILNSSSRIAIIESNPVESFPFSALLTQPILAGAKGFRDASFAVEKHAFSYHQSPSAFFDAQANAHFENSIKLSALAPSQLSNEPFASTSQEVAPTIGLDYAIQEVETLIERFQGNLLKGKEADFNGLVQAFQKSNVIHIASHASSNLANGEFSYIVLTDPTLLSGERIYARTLTELELAADLVVLGSCESGLGTLRGGEGTMSLANVFLHAGTQSVLHTSWRVEDKRSQEILLGFYDELERKAPKDKALVAAQQGYLQAAGGQYLHPFYWSSFAISGNLNPIESRWLTLLYYALPILLLGLFILFWRRR